MASTGDIFGGAGSIVGGIGSLVQGFGTASVDQTEAAGFGQAAQFAQQNAVLSGEVGGLQQLAQARQIQHVQGTAAATAAGNGLQMAGSALSLAKDSTQQGALAQGLIGLQTTINVQGFEAQAAADQSMQQASEQAASNAETGGIFGFLGGALGAAKLLF